MRRKGLVSAAALLAAANAVSLIGAARNRAHRLQSIELTENELPIAFQPEDNSGITLRLTVANEAPIGGVGMEWLDSKKLRELGFDTDRRPGGHYRETPPRPVYLALEYDGPSWPRFLEDTRKVWHEMGEIERAHSRLLAVDAARSPGVLLSRYGQTGRHLIVRGTVARTVSAPNNPPNNRGTAEGRIVDLVPLEIHVSLPRSSALQSLLRRPNAGQVQRYSVRLAYGANFEPWVESVAAK